MSPTKDRIVVSPSIAPSTERLATWGAVERQLEEARNRVQTASDVSAVGEACSAVLLMLLGTTLLSERSSFPQGPSYLSKPLLEVLDDCVSMRLSGPTRDAAKANLALAGSVIGAGIASLDQAEVALTSTTTLVRLLGISSGFRPSRVTIANLCERFLSESKDLGYSQGYTIQRLLRMPIAKKLASELTTQDVIDHCQLRRDAGTAASTIMQDVIYLRGVIVKARDTWSMNVSTDPIDHVKPRLLEMGLTGRSTPRSRRPTREEIQRLLDYFVLRSKNPRTKIPMHIVMEFALWSARRVGEICTLRWEDLDERNKKCAVIVTDSNGQERKHYFPLLGRAWDIVQGQPRDSDRVFPYKRESVIQNYVEAKKRLGIDDLRLSDLRREAAIRLYEAGNSVEKIAELTGRLDLNTLFRDVSVESKIESKSSLGSQQASK
jgi:integrase